MKQKKIWKKAWKKTSKQATYFVSLGLFSLLLLVALTVLNLNHTQSLWQGSAADGELEAKLSECGLEDCSSKSLKNKINQLQKLLNKNIIKEAEKVDAKPVKIKTKINFIAETAIFEQQLEVFSDQLDLLDDKEGKKAEKYYARYLKALIKKLSLAETKAVKQLNVLDFNKEGLIAIKKYIQLKQNITSARFFLTGHIDDLNIKDKEKKNILSYLRDSKIDQNLLSALLDEHQSRALSKKADKDQKNNKSDIVSQFSSNNDISRSIHLHYQAQAYIFALNQHKYNSAFDNATDRWILDKIEQTEKYIKLSNKISKPRWGSDDYIWPKGSTNNYIWSKDAAKDYNYKNKDDDYRDGSVYNRPFDRNNSRYNDDEKSDRKSNDTRFKDYHLR